MFVDLAHYISSDTKRKRGTRMRQNPCVRMFEIPAILITRVKIDSDVNIPRDGSQRGHSGLVQAAPTQPYRAEAQLK
jgi:hypothetical protein